MSINDIAISVNPEEVLRLVYTFQENDREFPQGQQIKGCPFGHSTKELDKNVEIDTFSKYQRKKSSNKMKLVIKNSEFIMLKKNI